ncbi:hypothetical protein BHF71_00875 [Vulcanibacillus modesticaldus]|uniref:Copper amine oxidase-like N-terminal domain-containing protein n=1 Tax=Vulcanibacillus modesticaldus TaxID=337097 RepID=A0A1D2YVK8_9BACI|nr:copper amine oxidase N-terminal domain-containing protein [Vulcanibacillus modesticaldus]OEF99760.1 hypothetical protein BHF71_00875 [Vulcanibacillus modesticaldus]
MKKSFIMILLSFVIVFTPTISIIGQAEELNTDTTRVTADEVILDNGSEDSVIGEDEVVDEEVDAIEEDEIIDEDEEAIEEDEIVDEDEEAIEEDEIVDEDEDAIEEDEIIDEDEEAIEEDEVIDEDEDAIEEDEIVDEDEEAIEEDEVIDEDEDAIEEDEIADEDEDAIEEDDMDEMKDGRWKEWEAKKIKKELEKNRKLLERLEKKQRKLEKQREKLQKKIRELKGRVSKKWAPLLQELNATKNTDESIQRVYSYLNEGLAERKLSKDEIEELEELIDSFKDTIEEELEQKEIEEEVEKVEDIKVEIQNKIEAFRKLREVYQLMDRQEDVLLSQEQIFAFTRGDKKEAKKLIELYKKLNKKRLTAYVNGKEPVFDVPPQILNGRTLVPFRAISETLGAEVTYDPTTKTVSIKKGDITISFVISDNKAKVNGRIVQLDVPAMVVNNRTVVPLRFLSESLGADVQYDPATNLIFIND